MGTELEGAESTLSVEDTEEHNKPVNQYANKSAVSNSVHLCIHHTESIYRYQLYCISSYSHRL